MTVTDIQNSLLKYKRPLALFVAMVVLLCHFYLGFAQTYTATVYIKYVGENAENGQAANGSVLKPYEITDSYVVGEALKQLGINDMKASSLAQKITVTPVLSKAEQEKYASWIDQFSSYEETEDNKLNPVYYCIQFESDDGIQFARDFLGALVQQYRIYYAQKYVGERVVVAETESAILNADYFIATQRLQGRLETNMDYLRTIVNGDKNYRSPSTGYSLSDLIDAHDFFLETRLAPVNRYILDLGISKDADTLIASLRNSITDYSLTYPTEDRAVLMAAAMCNFAWDFEPGSGAREKLRYYADCIRDCFDTELWPEITYWEQVLNESSKVITYESKKCEESKNHSGSIFHCNAGTFVFGGHSVQKPKVAQQEFSFTVTYSYRGKTKRFLIFMQANISAAQNA